MHSHYKLKISRAILILAILLPCCLATLPPAFAGTDRLITRTRNPLAPQQQPDRLWWNQTDSIDLQYTVITNAAQDAWDLSGFDRVTWQVTSTDGATTYLAVTGTIDNAASGLISFDLTPSQSNLTNQYYSGYIAALNLTGTNVTSGLTLAEQVVEVRYSPDNRFFDLVGPLTGTTTDYVSRATYNIVQTISNHWDAATQTLYVNTNYQANVLTATDGEVATGTQTVARLVSPAQLKIAAETHAPAAHDPVTLGAGSDPALSISGQELILGPVVQPGDNVSDLADDGTYLTPTGNANSLTNFPNYQPYDWIGTNASDNVTLSFTNGGFQSILLTSASVTNLTVALPSNTNLIWRSTVDIDWAGSGTFSGVDTNNVTVLYDAPTVSSGVMAVITFEYTPKGGRRWR